MWEIACGCYQQYVVQLSGDIDIRRITTVNSYLCYVLYTYSGADSSAHDIDVSLHKLNDNPIIKINRNILVEDDIPNILIAYFHIL